MAVVVLMILALLCAPTAQNNSTNNTVKMGILLSGKGWPTGYYTLPAAKLAIKEIEDWGEEIEVELMVENSNCSVSQSYAAAHNLLTWGAKVIIGPACTTTCIPVTLLALQYGVPVISYACSGTELSIAATYPNFARTSESLSGASELLKLAFDKWKFERYSVMTTTDEINVDFAIDFVTSMRGAVDHETPSTTRNKREVEGNIDSDGEQEFKLEQLSTVVDSLLYRGDAVRNETVDQLHTLMDSAWVFFIPMYDSDANFILQNAAEEAGTEHGIAATEAWSKTNYGWFRYQSVVDEDYKNYYNRIFSLENDKPDISYNATYTTFYQKLNWTDSDMDDEYLNDMIEDKPDNLPLYLAYMYNAVIAWGTAYKAANYTTNYENIIENMKNMTYTGAYRPEQLEAAEPSNGVWAIRQYQISDDGDGEWVDVVIQNYSDPSNITVIESAIKWPNGKMINPCQDDICNDGEQSLIIVWVVVAVCIVLVIVVVAVSMFIVHKHKKQNTDDLKIDWKIAFTELDFAVKKSISGSRKLVGAGEEAKSSGMQVAKFNHNFVVVKNLNIGSIIVTKEILDDLYQLKRMNHPNLNTFYGLCDDPGYCSVITGYCSKGSLEDLAHNDNVHLDWMFKLSLIIDVAKGLRHLHTSQFGYHGDLRTSMCVVDSHWVCKLTDFGLTNLTKDSTGSANNSSTQNQGTNIRDLFYKAPEMLWPSHKQRTIKEIQKCDTYSFSIVMYELFAREEPYDTSDQLPETIINRIKNRESPPYRPNLDRLQVTKNTSYEQVGAEDTAHAVPTEAVELMKQCWAEMPFERINMADTVQTLEDMNPDRSLSITDRVVKMMEKYSEDLENKVAKKTLQLQNQQAGRNLCRFLPKKIIEKIENGLEIEKASGKYVTGVCIKVKIQDDIDQIAAINSYERFNNTEIESRQIYQVVDSDGHPVVVSGIYNEEKPAQQIIEYVQALEEYASTNSMSLKIAIHSGLSSCGLVMADTANPRLCLTGQFTGDLNALLNSTNFGQVLITEATRKDLSPETKTHQHVKIKLTDDFIDTHLLYLPSIQVKKLQNTHSAPSPPVTSPPAMSPIVARVNQ